MEILAFCRRELATTVYTSAQMLNHTIIAIKSRHSLTINYKMGITIFMFACYRYQDHALEIKRTFIPTGSVFSKTGQCWRNFITHVISLYV